MAKASAKKRQSREKILTTAAKLFITQGYEAVSIDDVMAEAGMTRGGFYAHFPSKASLYQEAIVTGARHMKCQMMAEPVVSTVCDLATRYFSIDKGKKSNLYCPLSFLVTDITHRDKKVRKTYTQILEGYQKAIRETGVDRDTAIQVSVLLIGGLALSRTVDDPTVKEDILNNCLSAIKKLTEIPA